MMNDTKLTLAVTWIPRGELSRFERSLPLLREMYDSIVISFPPVADPSVTELFTNGRFAADRDILVVVNPEWSFGRYMAIKLSLETSPDYIHYVDMDRLLRWIETHPDELRITIGYLSNSDCLIVGRTEKAYSTHPQALRQTEAISNRVASYFLGRDMDVSAGSKGFSRRAAQYIVDHCFADHALGADAEWPVILHRAGFEINYVLADGLAWESADRFQMRAANTAEQLQAASRYDANPENWEYRVGIAEEIVRSAIQAYNHSLDPKESKR